MFKTIKDISSNLLKHPYKRYNFRDTNTINKIIVHQTDSEDRGQFSPYDTANYHVNTNDWAGIGYHYYIIKNGEIFQTNRDDVISYHASGNNANSLGVVITGEHRCSIDDDNYLVLEPEQYNGLVYTLAKLSMKYNIASKDIIGHTETGSPKSCPNLNLDQLRADVKKKRYSFGQRTYSLVA